MEDAYYYEWITFKNKNKNKTELDFIEEKLAQYADEEKKYKERMRLNNLSNSQLLMHIKDINYRNYNSEEIKVFFTEASILEDFRKKNNRRQRVSNVSKQTFELHLMRLKHSSALANKTDESLVDLTDTKLVEKIIMLHELGVLEYLKGKTPFNLSTNALASVISGITGGKPETIQSYINPIFNSEVSQKNNPLKTTNTVDKVKRKLIGIGCSLT